MRAVFALVTGSRMLGTMTFSGAGWATNFAVTTLEPKNEPEMSGNTNVNIYINTLKTE